MERLDPENNIFYLFIVNGDSNLRSAGEVVEAVFPRVHAVNGAEHVLYPFFDDISKIPEIKVSDLCDN